MDKIVLLVEDNRDDEALALRAFTMAGVRSPVVARDGREALEWLFAEGAHSGRDLNVVPDLIVLDLKLSRVHGLEVLRRVRGDPRTRMIPVVILSASDEERDIAMAYTLGANSYVRKSVNFSEFADSIQRLSAYWFTVNMSPPL